MDFSAGSSVERTHADLERHHYQALNDPRYVAALLLDEAWMALEPALAPHQSQGEIPELFSATPREIENILQEAIWSKRQWSYVRQLEAKVLFLQNKINEHLDQHKRGDTDKPTGIVDL